MSSGEIVIDVGWLIYLDSDGRPARCMLRGLAARKL